MITQPVRLSYASIWEPKADLSGNMKYSCCLLIPKKDKKAFKELQQAIDSAVEKGVEKGLFKKSMRLKMPLRDGDLEVENGARGPEYTDMYFLNCSNTRAPGIVDQHVQPIMDQDEVYSGCWIRADISFFPFSRSGNKGVGVGLNNIMKVKDDERLDGRMKAEDAFKDYAIDNAENMSDDDVPF